MPALKQPDRLTEEEYLAGELTSEIKHELIDGQVYAMSGGSRAHSYISLGAGSSLRNQLKGKPCFPYNSDLKVRIPNGNYFYPDVLVSCDQTPDQKNFTERPVVIIEVLSKSTRGRDLVQKRHDYFTLPSLLVYLTVEQDKVEVVAHRRSTEGTPLTSEYFTTLEDSIPLPEIDAALPLADLYLDITFPED